MSEDLTPIPTEYKGCTFRSRLEARWAVYFDQFKIGWEFEREGFQLDSGWYVPDFWLPEFNTWAEVKPRVMTAFEYRKCAELARRSGFEVLLLEGYPSPRNYWSVDRDGRHTDYQLDSLYSDEHRFFSCPVGGEYPMFEMLDDATLRTVCDIVKNHRFW